VKGWDRIGDSVCVRAGIEQVMVCESSGYRTGAAMLRRAGVVWLG
jgi:hypothetical protein